MSKKLPFTHLRVGLDGLTVAGQVWAAGDLVPLDGSTPAPVSQHVLEVVVWGEHPHLTAGTVERDEFKPLELPAVEEETSEAD